MEVFAVNKGLYLRISYFYLLLMAFILVITNMTGCGKNKSQDTVVKELVQDRSDNSYVFANEDGTMTSVLYADAVNFKDKEGNWRQVDTTIRRNQTTQTPFKAKFGKQGRLSFLYDDRLVEFVPLRAKRTEGVTAQNKIVYPEIFNEADLKYTVEPNRIKEEIILKNPKAPKSFIFAIIFDDELPKVKNGALDFGPFRTLPPVAIDAKGRHGRVAVDIRKVNGKTSLVMGVDPEWAALAAYPIVIDPTIVIQPDNLTGKDAYVNDIDPQTNFGDDERIAVSTASGNARAYIQFDLQAVPVYANVTQAIFRVYAEHSSLDSMNIRRVLTGWQQSFGDLPESAIDWDNQPRFGEIVGTSGNIVTGDWLSADITKQASDWIKKKTVNNGLVLLADEISGSGEAVFYSSNYSIDPLLRPKLEVTYTLESNPPRSKIESFTDGDYLKGEQVLISGSADDSQSGSGISRVDVSTNGGESWEPAVGSEIWSYTWSAPEDGEYRIMSRSIDVAGNVEETPVEIGVNIDNTVPLAEITEPVDGGMIKGRINIKGTAFDLNMDNYIIEYGEGQVPSSYAKLGSIQTANAEDRILGSVNPLSMNGVYTFRLSVTDLAGNVTSAKKTFTLENPVQAYSGPHKNYSADTDLCALCHRSHVALSGRLNYWLEPEATYCYTCHQGVSGADNTIAAVDESVSHHPIKDRMFAADPDHTIDCSRCHDPHGNERQDGSYYESLVRIKDKSGTNHYEGNETCGVCHGSDTSETGQALGGDHITDFNGLAAHDTRVPDPTSGTKIKCSNCHEPHGSKNYRLTFSNEEDLCYQCHNSANLPNSMGGEDIQASFAKPSHHGIEGDGSDYRIECSSCHGPHTVRDQAGLSLSNPDNTKSIFTGGTTSFCIKCHDGDPPKEGANPNSVVPYTIEFPANKSALFPGWDKLGYVLYPAAMSSIAQCDTCHKAHGSQNPRLTALNGDDALSYSEEGLCITCHQSGNSQGASDIASILQKSYKHPVDTKSGIHNDDETSSGLAYNETSSRRHAECTDCHDPHEATNSPVVSPNVKGANNGVSGVSGDGNAIVSVAYEYEICYKCHSSYTGQLPGADDVSAEFDPTNDSYHPVTSIGANQGIDPAAFVSPWNSNQQIYCSDCHGNDSDTQAQCLAGSANNHILKDNYGAGQNQLCFRCHNPDSYVTPGSPGSRWLGHNASAGHSDCSLCHDSHGSKQPHMMNRGYFHYQNGGVIVTDNSCSGDGCHAIGEWKAYPTAY